MNEHRAKKSVARRLFRTLYKAKSSLFLRTRFEVISVDMPFENNGMEGDFKRMLDGSITDPFSEETDRFVYYIQTPTDNYYLKRSTYQTPRSLLRHLLRGRRTHTDVVWEGFAVQMLKNNGFSVMEPVAWGEELWLGIWPLRGFLLVKEVIGEEMVELLANEGNHAVRHDAFKAMGQYIGRLHGIGLLHAPRVRNYILERPSESDIKTALLTMIDVDLKGLRPILCPFEPNKSIETLAVSVYLFLRTGQSINRSEALRFIRGYKSGIRHCGHHLTPGYLKTLVNSVNLQLTKIQLDPELKAVYHKAFASVADGISA